MADPYPGETIPEKAGNIPPADWQKALRHLASKVRGYTSAVSIAEAVFGNCQPCTHKRNGDAILHRMVVEGLVEATDTPSVWKVSAEHKARILGVPK